MSKSAGGHMRKCEKVRMVTSWMEPEGEKRPKRLRDKWKRGLRD